MNCFSSDVGHENALRSIKPQLAFDETAPYEPWSKAVKEKLTELLGERVWEVSRAIDALAEFPQIDTERIACLGNSGGGTTTYYAACMDERIKIAVASCSVCTFIESIGITAHCTCNYLPGMAKYLDMGELAACIAPRKLIVVSGRQDPIFHIEGSKAAFDVIKKIYRKEGCPDNCEMVIGEGGHRFYAEPTWDIINRLTGWKE